MADPKRSKAAERGAWKRTMNERRIEGLQKQADALVEALREAWKLVHPGDRDFAPKAAALIAKHGE
jgi:hypothetical protein